MMSTQHKQEIQMENKKKYHEVLSHPFRYKGIELSQDTAKRRLQVKEIDDKELAANAYANLPNEHCTILQDKVFGDA